MFAMYVATVISLVVYVICWRWKNRKLLKLADQLKSDFTCLPLIGHSYKFAGTDEDRMQAFQNFGRESLRKGGLSSMWLGQLLFLNVTDPKIAEFIFKNYLEKAYIMKYAREIIGNGSIFAPVSIWRPRRKILVPTFSPKNVQQFCHVFAKQSSMMIRNINSRVGMGPFSVWNYFTTYTMDAICETTMGIQLDAQTNHNHPFIQKFDIGSNLISARLLNPWLHPNFIYKLTTSYRILQNCKQYLTEFIGEIIRAKRKEMESRDQIIQNTGKDDFHEYTQKAFLELLIESSGGPKGYTDEELLEELSVLVMAGNDTTAVSSGFITLMLSRYPDVQEKAFQEIKEVFGSSTRSVTPEDLTRIKYVEAVIKETLRLYPPVPVIGRLCDRDLTLPSGLMLVKGTNFIINIWALHRNTKYWGPDAEEFRPERWFEMGTLRHPAQYIAFSYGARNCLGGHFAISSMKTVICQMLRNYKILPGSEPTLVYGKLTQKPIKLKYDIMMKDVDMYTVCLEKRT